MNALRPRCRPVTTDIFLDESGDLGWGLGGSTYLVLCAVASESPDSIKRAVRRVKRKHRIPGSVELHASGSQPQLLEDLLRRLAQLDIAVMTTVVHKPNVVPKLRVNPNILYNYASRWTLCKYIAAQDHARLFIDRRISRMSRRALSLPDYLRTQIWAELRSDVDLEIRMCDSAHVLGIQAADFVANAIFKKYERGQTWAYNLIGRKVGDEFVLFQG